MMIVGTLADANERRLELCGSAACTGMDVNIFYDESLAGVLEAKNTCRECPVQVQCLDYALRYERYGTWAGVSEKDRIAMRRPLRIKLVDVYTRQPHTSSTNNPNLTAVRCGAPGTGGYCQHKRRGEAPCRLCLEQYNIANRDYVARVKVINR